MVFEILSPNQIIFGCSSVNQISEVARNMGGKALIVCGGGSVHTQGLLDNLHENRIDAELFKVVKEPDIPIIRKGLDFARTKECDFVIGFGGGSVLDSAKALSALLTNPGDILDYLEALPKPKIHCSILGIDALKAAIKEYKSNN